MLGFGLCLVGAFVAGYGDSLHSTANIADGWILKYASILGVAPNGSYLTQVLAQTNSYFQHDVATLWVYYVAAGVVMAIGGVILVAAGDGKVKSAGTGAAGRSRPSR
jgi:hypothetical protein